MKEKQTNEASRLWVPPELVAQAKAGDQAAFTELYELTSAGLYRTIHAMVRDEDLAWDIQQDSYLQAFRALDKLEANEAFLSWLRRIAVNVTAKKMAQRRPLTFTELAGEEDEGEPELPDFSIDAQPELALDRKETARLVREILSGLPESQQMILGMFYYEDMPIREIADTLRVSQGTVKSQLCFGRKKVEAGVRALEKQGVKLYGLSPLPFLLALLGRLEPSAQAEKKVLAAVLAETPAATAAAGTAGASTVTALTASQAFLKGLGAKLLAGVLALSLIAVGGKLAYDALAERKLPPIGIEQPTAEETAAPSESNDTAENTVLTEPPEANAIPENACGPNLTWRFEEVTGTLIIEGSGEMYDFSGDPPPWFSVRELITSVALPNELSSIGGNAFCESPELTSITIPEGVTSIGDYAFSYCAKLKSVTIPESVTTIGVCAFDHCASLTSVMIHEGVTTIGEGTFDGCTGLMSVTIPKSVTAFGNGAFRGCANLTSVTIPEGVTAIGEEVFLGCTSLTFLTIPESVSSIGRNAFSECYRITVRGVPGSEAERYANAYGLPFVDMNDASWINGRAGNDLTWNFDPDTQTLTIEGSGDMYNYDYETNFLPPWAGSEETEMIFSVVLPEGLTSIGNLAFNCCTSLSYVTIPEGVTSIGVGAFGGCGGLSSVTLPESLTSIGNSAFTECCELTDLTIPSGVTFIGENAFSWSGLTAVTIPASVAFIGKCAFDSCCNLTAFDVDPTNQFYSSDNGVLYNKAQTALIAYPPSKTDSFKIPKGVTVIGDYAFNECWDLSSVIIPEGVASIGKSAFSGCHSLSSVTLPDSLISIGNLAFSGTRLTNLTIPKNVSSIGNCAFSLCNSLTSISVDRANTQFYADKSGGLYSANPFALLFYPQNNSGEFEIPEGVTYIGDYLFQDSKLTAVTFPSSLTSIGNSAFRHSALHSAVLPEGVTSIGDWAFSNCAALTDLTIPASVRTIEANAFEISTNLTIRGVPGSEAERYANEKGISFEAIP